jgi:hypothetical protein
MEPLTYVGDIIVYLDDRHGSEASQRTASFARLLLKERSVDRIVKPPPTSPLHMRIIACVILVATLAAAASADPSTGPVHRMRTYSLCIALSAPLATSMNFRGTFSGKYALGNIVLRNSTPSCWSRCASFFGSKIDIF